MGAITDFLRKIGVLQMSSGDYQTGDIDNREDLKKEPMNAEMGGMSEDEASTEETPGESSADMPMDDDTNQTPPAT